MLFLKKHYRLLSVLGIVILFIAVIVVTFVGQNTTKNIQTNERDENVLQIKVINDYINIRKDADTNSEVLGKVYDGEIYTVLKQVDGDYSWYLIETSTGIKGYIAGEYDGIKYVEILKSTNDIKDNDNEALENDKGEPDYNNENGTENTNDNMANNQNNVKQYKVFFNTNGGEAIAPKVVDQFDLVGSLPTPVRNGYIFQYWEYQGGMYFDNLATTLDSDITLNAVWKKDISSAEKIKAIDELHRIIENNGYYTVNNNGGIKYLNEQEEWTIHLIFTLGEGMSIYYFNNSKEYSCFYNWNKTPTMCQIDSIQVNHDQMSVLFPYENQLFNDAYKIYNEFLATGYTLEYLKN